MISPSEIAGWLEHLIQQHLPLTRANLVAELRASTSLAVEIDAKRASRRSTPTRKRSSKQPAPREPGPARPPRRQAGAVGFDRFKVANDPTKIICPECNAIVPKINLAEHRRGLHGKPAVSPAKSVKLTKTSRPKRPPKGRSQVCPICHRKIRLGMMTLHNDSYHPQRGTDALDHAVSLNSSQGIARVKASKKKRGSRPGR